VAVTRFSQQVQVIPLHGEMYEPEAEAFASTSERSLNYPKHRRPTQRLDPAPDTERDVNGMMTRQCRTTQM
jgi:hypothetical protein